MAGPALDRQLNPPATAGGAAGVRFARATERDDAAIRRLLRENPTPGEISLSFEREPDYFRGNGLAGAIDDTVLAFDRAGGQVICMGRCSTRERFVNGEPRRVGYLGELRLDRSAQGRFDVVRRGYRFLRELHAGRQPDLYFTSIAADNRRSIAFLERGVPGLPAYRFAAGFVTVVLPSPRAGAAQRLRRRAEERLRGCGCRFLPGAEAETEAGLAGWLHLLNVHGSQYQLAGGWTADQWHSLARLGLSSADLLVINRGGRLAGGAGLWDQRSFRQVVLRRYSGRMALARPWLNCLARLSGRPRLPAAGSTLAHAFLSPMAVDPGQPPVLVALVEMGLARAAERGLDYLTLGFDARDPRLGEVRRQFGGREYASRLYRVCWPEESGRADEFDGRLFLPESALL